MENISKSSQFGLKKSDSENRIEKKNLLFSNEFTEETFRNLSRPNTTFQANFALKNIFRPESAKFSKIIHSKTEKNSKIRPSILGKKLNGPMMKLTLPLPEKKIDRSTEISNKLLGIGSELKFEPINSFSVRSIQIESPVYAKNRMNTFRLNSKNCLISQSLPKTERKLEKYQKKSEFKLKNTLLLYDEIMPFRGEKNLKGKKVWKNGNFSKGKVDVEAISKKTLKEKSPLMIRQLRYLNL